MLLKIQLKRALFNKTMLLAIFLGIVIQIYSAFAKIQGVVTMDRNSPSLRVGGYEAIYSNNVNIFSLWYFSTDLYCIVIPLICCLPFVTSYLQEKKSKYVYLITVRESYKKYGIYKAISIFLSGFISVFISSILFFILINVCFPNTLQNSTITVYGFFSGVADYDKNLYIFLYVIICSFMGGVFALMALAISTVFNNYIVTILFPIMFWFVGSFIAGTLNIQLFEPAAINGYMVRPKTTWFEVILQPCLYMVIAIKIFYNDLRRSRI